jgi:hypothetical protein
VLEHGIEIVDCVEFDSGLREIDVGLDLAFLVIAVLQAEEWQPLDEVPPGRRISIHTDRSASDVLAALRGRLNARVARTTRRTTQ